MKQLEKLLRRNRGEEGFILATVLVFLVVLSLAAFFAARLTGANTQGVNNLQTEKQALGIAEAGIDEALYRLNLKSPSCVSMGIAAGISVGCTGLFDASIAPRVGSEVGGSILGLDGTNPGSSSSQQSTTQILLSTTVPTLTGTNITTPSLQPASLRLPYTTPTADTSPVDLSTTSNLTIGWDLCTAVSTTNGCDNNASHVATYNPYYPIRALPLSSPRPVVKIVSTGTVKRTNGDVVASRKITVKATDCPKGSTNGNILTTSTGCNGINLSGSSSVTATGSIHVDAGTSATCTGALSTGGSSSVTSLSGEITSVGGVQGSASNYSPSATPGSNYQADPYNDPPKPVTYPPCFESRTTNCDANYTYTSADRRGTGTPTSPAKFSPGGGTMSPGIYYGGVSISNNVTLSAGIYVMAGGGFEIHTGSTLVTGSNVLIVNTANPDTGCTGGLCAAGPINITGGNAATNIVGRSPGQSYDGFVMFQDRLPTNRGGLPANQPDVQIQGGTTSTPLLGGIVYAPDAALLMQGNNTIRVGGTLVVSSISNNGSSSLVVEAGSGSGSDCTGATYAAISWQDF